MKIVETKHRMGPQTQAASDRMLWRISQGWLCLIRFGAPILFKIPLRR